MSTGGVSALPGDTLRYTTDKFSVGKLIRYEQVAFVEYQKGDGDELKYGAIFYAASASNKTFLEEALTDQNWVR